MANSIGSNGVRRILSLSERFSRPFFKGSVPWVMSAMDSPSLGFEARLRQMQEQAQTGDNALLGQLLEAYRPYLLTIANAELESDLRVKAGGSDLVQQTFMEANDGIAVFRGTTEAELLSWLRQILLHNLANLRRQYRDAAKRDVRREIPLEGFDSSWRGKEPSPSKQVAAREEAEAMERALQRLPADYQTAIRLRHQEQRSFAEIGAALGRSAEAARKLWARAIEALQTELKSP